MVEQVPLRASLGSGLQVSGLGFTFTTVACMCMQTGAKWHMCTVRWATS